GAAGGGAAAGRRRSRAAPAGGAPRRGGGRAPRGAGAPARGAPGPAGRAGRRGWPVSREAPTKPELGITIDDLYRLDVDQYHAIADAGILDEDDPVELLEGWLVCKYGPFDALRSRLSPPTASPEDEERGLTLAWIWRFS